MDTVIHQLLDNEQVSKISSSNLLVIDVVLAKLCRCLF